MQNQGRKRIGRKEENNKNLLIVARGIRVATILCKTTLSITTLIKKHPV
jgi:hypothetical protein